MRASITRGGVAQVLARLGERCQPIYLALVESVRKSLVVVMDEIEWRVLGGSAWLWVAAGELVTVCAIRQGRGFKEAAELIGEDYPGRLVRDGWAPYRKFEKAVHRTCAAHLLRRCDELLEVARGRAREVLRTVRAILLGALELRDRRDASEIGEEDFQAELVELQERLRAQLARPVSGNDSPQGRLLRHLHREFDAVFTFPKSRGCPPPTGWRSRRFAPPWPTGRSGAATGPGPEHVIKRG